MANAKEQCPTGHKNSRTIEQWTMRNVLIQRDCLDCKHTWTEDTRPHNEAEADKLARLIQAARKE